MKLPECISLDDGNTVANIISQSERKTLEDCILIAEQIIDFLHKKMYRKSKIIKYCPIAKNGGCMVQTLQKERGNQI